MPFCASCGKEVLDQDKFCLNCGRPLQPGGVNPFTQPAQAPTAAVTPSQQPGTVKRAKNPALAAVLNLFLPGVGYVYNGTGRDDAQVVFGALIFASVFVGFYLGFTLQLFFPQSGGSSSSADPGAYLILLLFLLPWALAYDGYMRAKSSQP